ncbi:2-amino-4-hydroxy-6-hydroxymethyldihydropteridine diphosphokinase [Paenibacillus sp. GCM10012307]|nr:2-amino-4-hydroxy-6-hydroxymethyldihydropteridine diphosphokinase [Paenibacillus roseus]
MERSLPHGLDERPAIDDQPKAAFIALGSNMGNRDELLLQALHRLNIHPEVEIQVVSAMYETDPVGFTEQPAFLNMAARIETVLAPLDLLHVMQNIEKELGRVRHERWGPRTIDLDLLHYEGVTMDTEELILPHPRMMERGFVLVPLKDCMSDYEAEPWLREEVAAGVDRVERERKEGILLWNTINWPSG